MYAYKIWRLRPRSSKKFLERWYPRLPSCLDISPRRTLLCSWINDPRRDPLGTILFKRTHSRLNKLHRLNFICRPHAKTKSINFKIFLIVPQREGKLRRVSRVSIHWNNSINSRRLQTIVIPKVTNPWAREGIVRVVTSSRWLRPARTYNALTVHWHGGSSRKCVDSTWEWVEKDSKVSTVIEGRSELYFFVLFFIKKKREWSVDNNNNNKTTTKRQQKYNNSPKL